MRFLSVDYSKIGLPRDSFVEMAIDEALMISLTRGALPSVRFYDWSKNAVSLGYFQDYRKELNLSSCLDDGVEIFRRLTGGGAVFKFKEGEYNYSLIVKSGFLDEDVIRSYKQVAEVLILSLSKFGLEARMQGINDLVVGLKKVSGSAQTRKDEVILQHGTVLFDFDVKKMLRYLNISKKKLSDKEVDSFEQRVGTIKDFLSLDFESFKQSFDLFFLRSFEELFAVEFVDDGLSDEEIELIRELYEKYVSDEWIFMR